MKKLGIALISLMALQQNVVLSCNRDDGLYTSFVSCSTLLNLHRADLKKTYDRYTQLRYELFYYHCIYRAYNIRTPLVEDAYREFIKESKDFREKYASLNSLLEAAIEKSGYYQALFNQNPNSSELSYTGQLGDDIKNAYQIINKLQTSDCPNLQKIKSSSAAVRDKFKQFEQELVTDVPFERCFHHMCSLLQKHEKGHDVDEILASIKIDPNLNPYGKIGALERYIGHIQDKMDQVQGIEFVMQECSQKEENQHLTAPQLARIPRVLNVLQQDFDRFTALHNASSELVKFVESRSQNTKLALP